jgi:ribosomal protein S18 acetylase RimI-like enzyme
MRAEDNASGVSMTTIIRPMMPEDVDAVRQVEAAAFGAWLKQAHGREKGLPWRTRTNVLALREKDPNGCFVAEQDGRLVGFIFSRTWGSVGWFGTFAVLPESQGQGVGKRLIAASLEYLRRGPRRVIGLETMPDSPDNLGLYLKRGFQARLLTLHLNKALDLSVQDDGELPRWSETDVETRDRWLADLQEATDRVCPGLDYSKEITSIARHGLGDAIFLIQDGRAVGASTIRLVGIREDHEEAAAAHPVFLHPAHTNEETFHTLLAASETLARARGKRDILVSINARHTWALARALEAGYRVKRARVRMVLAGTDPEPRTDDYVNLSRWAG